VSRRAELLALAKTVKGFMPDNEGLALYKQALAQGQLVPAGTWLEIGAWCGKSAVYLGEENQEGWVHFDRTLVDERDGRLNTLPSWQRTIAEAGLESTVVGLVGPSSVVAPHFDQALDLLFIDGGHGHEVAWADYEAWTPKVSSGGLLLIHDVFENPDEGGRPPHEIYQAALSSSLFSDVAHEGSLRVLRRS
jgi:predicted O-methyltransferase YrrM